MNRQCVLCELYRMCGEKKSESGVKRAKWHVVRTEYVLRCHSVTELNSESELIPQSEVYPENFPKFKGQRNPLSWTRELREVDDVIRIPVDNYQTATLATVKHRSEIIESVDDDDEIEWTEDPFEYKHWESWRQKVCRKRQKWQKRRIFLSSLSSVGFVTFDRLCTFEAD